MHVYMKAKLSLHEYKRRLSCIRGCLFENTIYWSQIDSKLELIDVILGYNIGIQRGKQAM